MGTIYRLLITGYSEMAIQILLELIPIILIAIISLIFGILNYRTNKKILKKMEGMESK